MMLSIKHGLLAIIILITFGFLSSAKSQTIIESGILGKEVAGSVGDKLKKGMTIIADSAATPAMTQTDPNLPMSPVTKIMDILAPSQNFKVLVKALKATGFDTLLNQTGPFTVFAPDDSAWAKISEFNIDTMTQDKSKLATVLKCHIMNGYYTIGNLNNLKSLDVQSAGYIALPTIGGIISVKEIPVVRSDQSAANGIVHEISSILIPLNKDNEADTSKTVK